MQKNRILVVAAHPDDEVLGCGAVIAKHVARGSQVYVLILGQGITSRFSRLTEASKKGIASLRRQAKRAAQILGVKKIYFADFPDNSFDSVALLKIIKVIENIKKEVKPSIIYTHYRGDLNIDHRITFQAVLTATRPLPGESVKEIYSFEIPSSTEWGSQPKEVFIPNVYIDIAQTIGKKIEAFKIYTDELRQWPHPRSIKGVGVLSQKRGAEAGLNYAEAFILIRSIKSEQT
jgi:LmbE family N-acetylglucosaminyl deacetylase